METGYQTTNKKFELINIFEKTRESLVIYRCFKTLNKLEFYVQSADFFYYPLDLEAVHNSQIQLIELFYDEDIEKREKPFPTLEEAIENFKAEFEGMA